MPKKDTAELLEIDGREVRITNPDKPYFSRDVQLSKLDVVRYYLSIAGGAIGGIRDRPIVLKRFVDGAEGEAFYQKRAPENRRNGCAPSRYRFRPGRTGEEVVVDDAAGLAWIVNLGCIELHPHAVRTGDLEHPDELRIDLDPGPGVPWEDVRHVTLVAREVLADVGLRGWPKTSGSRGMHVNVRIEHRWNFTEVRRAAWPSHAKSSAARPISRRRSGGRKSVTGLPRLQPERQGSHDMLGVFHSATSRRARLGAARVGGDRRLQPRGFYGADDAEAIQGHRRPARRDGRTRRLARRAARSRGSRRGGWPRRRTVAAALPENGRRSPTRRAVQGEGRDQTSAHTQDALTDGANSPNKEAALAGLDRWKAKHPDAASHLAVDDVLIDSMRGRSSTWTRIRVNLRHVPEDIRPPQETPDPDDDPTREWRELSKKRR
jgi:DNA ligase D-like protein (predicted polymerase)